ncbi:MAG TPA: excinuclease ABC subunit UvrC [Mollicutes bacterium]|nr:excinuclease ABC subunit UvrC [Mollicutes bacterium]
MIKEKLELLPHLPGCYLMKNSKGTIIYVGKAKDLKKRVVTYFNREHTGKTKVLVENIATFEYIVTKTEEEALILELNLIKKHDPKYNILLRDDKSYPYIELTNEKYPRLLVVRSHLKRKKNTRLFGPYPNAYAARKIVNMLNRMYPLRKCRILPDKECLYYHIKQCLGYCIHDISLDVIKQMNDEIVSFLKGNENSLQKTIEEEMYKASNNLNFERAAEMKSLLEDIATISKRQVIDLNDNIDRDVFGYASDGAYISIQVFHIRGGRIVERESTLYPLLDLDEEALTYHICSFYDGNNLKPREIFVPDIIDTKAVSKILEVKVINPKRGKKKHVLDMAMKNAKIGLEEKRELENRNEERSYNASRKLGEILSIDNLSRIEIFDNSHLFGTFSVSGMVVFIDGKPAKKEYRKYKITSDKVDDYNLMKEVIYRRYHRVLIEKLDAPDLIVVDGGKIQMEAASTTLNMLGMNIPICGLKKNDRHKTSALIYNEVEIPIDSHSNVFHLLERMQDEVHNFTIRYHKDIRSKGALESVLDNISGIGAKRKKELLKRFGSIEKIKEASVEELSIILPINVAYELNKYFKDEKKIQ